VGLRAGKNFAGTKKKNNGGGYDAAVCEEAFGGEDPLASVAVGSG
jgi:hypothetical protein